MEKKNIAVCGIGGAMGGLTAKLAQESDDMRVIAGYDKVSGVFSGIQVYSVLSDIPGRIDGVIDYSHPSAADAILKFCVCRGLALVSATTGYSEAQEDALRDAAKEIPVFRAKNFSYGMSVVQTLVETAASMLAGGYDIEIIESHHNRKADAPSGTAQLLVRSVAQGAQRQFKVLQGRSGADSRRSPDEITVHSVRAGSVVGIHEILFADDDEIITITHNAVNKGMFAGGSLRAMRFLLTQSAGYFSMEDLVRKK